MDAVEDDPKVTCGIDVTARAQGVLALRQRGGTGRGESRREGAAAGLQAWHQD